MPKCDFNKVALQHGCTPVNFQHIFITPFSKNNSGWLRLQVALFGFINELHNLNILQNLILLIFKLYVYKSRKSGVLKINSFIKLN